MPVKTVGSVGVVVYLQERCLKTEGFTSSCPAFLRPPVGVDTVYVCNAFLMELIPALCGPQPGAVPRT